MRGQEILMEMGAEVFHGDVSVIRLSTRKFQNRHLTNLADARLIVWRDITR